MKSELRAVPHDVIAGATIFEVWHDGAFIGAIYGADGPGVRIVSKFEKDVKRTTQVVEVQINPRALE